VTIAARYASLAALNAATAAASGAETLALTGATATLVVTVSALAAEIDPPTISDAEISEVAKTFEIVDFICFSFL
jgi:hypothetical protein